MIPKCPRLDCLKVQSPFIQGPTSGRTVRHGRYRRSSDSRWIERFRCRGCRKSFSRATENVCFGQKRRRLNSEIGKLYASGVTQRRIGVLVHANRKTVVRKIRFLAHRARLEHAEELRRRATEEPKISFAQFDDLETSEHTKWKPLSAVVAVGEDEIIFSYQVSRMPPKGVHAKRARKKYGRRPDERARGWKRLADELKPILKPGAVLSSDENPHYPRQVLQHLPGVVHVTHKSKRGSTGGQGELKKTRFDPLFAVNHTFAMLRANMSRLIRRTWSTTKTEQGLLDHLAIYVRSHNRVIRSRSPH